jgi:hypothetical protein
MVLIFAPTEVIEQGVHAVQRFLVELDRREHAVGRDQRRDHADVGVGVGVDEADIEPVVHGLQEGPQVVREVVVQAGLALQPGQVPVSGDEDEVRGRHDRVHLREQGAGRDFGHGHALGLAQRVREVALVVQVDGQHAVAEFAEVMSQQGGDGGFADATLLVGEHKGLHGGVLRRDRQGRSRRRTVPGRRARCAGGRDRASRRRPASAFQKFTRTHRPMMEAVRRVRGAGFGVESSAGIVQTLWIRP